MCVWATGCEPPMMATSGVKPAKVGACLQGGGREDFVRARMPGHDHPPSLSRPTAGLVVEMYGPTAMMAFVEASPSIWVP